MNSIGLDTRTLQTLRQIFAAYPEVEQVKLYGSRAKGTFKAHSDIDLVAFGNNLDRFLIARILMDLDDSNIPNSVDLQSYTGLKNRQLIEHIDRVGVVIYDKAAFRSEPKRAGDGTSTA